MRLVAAVFHHDKITVAYIGDSLVYRFRRDALAQFMRDHALRQEQIDVGLVNLEWDRFAQNRNLMTRAVGVGPSIEVEIHDCSYIPVMDIFYV